jgi:hypothetical protein
VIITVITVNVMEMIVHQIIGVTGVRHTLMAAGRSMDVSCGMAGAAVIRRALRSIDTGGLDRMLVRVLAINVVEMAIVKIIRVAVVSDSRVTACGSVRMHMPFMLLPFVSHDPAPSYTMR